MTIVIPFAKRRSVMAQSQIKTLSEGFRVASEAFVLASDLGCSGDLYDALWALCEREAKLAEASKR